MELVELVIDLLSYFAKTNDDLRIHAPNQVALQVNTELLEVLIGTLVQ